jgi:hypothetical protein
MTAQSTCSPHPPSGAKQAHPPQSRPTRRIQIQIRIRARARARANGL